ncbi:hypothetical protein PASE110613_04905 [Paenibacillus sediminis]|uniref:Uncharacterized protein n=1 Tax=Paenibacillus sediminis TaxID=664909 RepID=A0ABS4H1G4_9BACL|nr:hypothetical protein [Paenibacillus sediminis]MBP1936112.1 hypothetical protein [Paenibacillus sediminis]
MKKLLMSILFSTLLCSNIFTAFADDSSVQKAPAQDSTIQKEDQDKIKTESYSRRGGFRSPSRSFTGGYGGTSPGYRTGPRAPSPDITRQRQPYVGQPNTGSRWGSFFGGLAAGTLLGHILHPFGGYGYGYGYGGGGFSIFGLIFWAVIIYLGYRLFQKMRR